MHLTEDLLYFIWKFRLFNGQLLQTVDGESLLIRSPGYQNTDSGPDFDLARIRIGPLEWSGNVEIHLRSSDWNLHKHQYNELYDTVILHVVFEHDCDIFRSNGLKIPVLELKNRTKEAVLRGYEGLMGSLNWIPCENTISQVSSEQIRNFLPRLLIESLQRKSDQVNALLKENKGSWEDAFYVMLARNFGFKVNSLPFELIARSLPRTLLLKHSDNLRQLESLLFGQAGFLDHDLTEEYPRELRREYLFLKNKYSLTPVPAFLWKFSRLRPNNFPTIRLAQFGALFHKSTALFSNITELEETDTLRYLFCDLEVHEFWNNHYHFRKDARKPPARMGSGSVNNILCNTVAPFLFVYSLKTNDHLFLERSVKLLEALPPEKNRVVQRFERLGIKATSNADSQALLHLKKSYCDHKKCLNCGIGAKLLNKRNDTAHLNLF